jgi:preprotein translocase subunit SecG
MLKRLLILFVFFKSFGAFSQKSIVVEKKGLGSVNDTVVVKIDTTNKKVFLLSKNKSITEFKISKVNAILKSDSTAWSIKTKPDRIKVLTRINRLVSSEVNIDSVADFLNFLSSKKDTTSFLVFNSAQSVVSDSLKTGIEGGGGEITLVPQKSIFEKYLIYILVSLLIIFFICSIVFLILWKLESKKIKSYKKEKEINIGNKIFEELKKNFSEGLKSKEYNGENTQTLIAHIAAIYSESKSKIASLNNDLKIAKESDLQKHTKIQDLQKQIDLLNSKLTTISKEHEDRLNDYRTSIIEICKKMLVRHREFNAKYQGGTFELELAKKDILQFNIAYTQLAFDVFATLAESANEEAKMNIELLNGKTVAPIKVLDQFSEGNSFSPIVNLIIQILEDNNIKSIDGVYFKGNKIDLK